MLVRVRGTIYPSVQSAADALGMTTDAVYGAITRGKEDILGLGKTKPKKIVIGDTEFKSLRAASTALGLKPKTLGETLIKGGKVRKQRLDDAIARYLEKASKP